MGWGSWRSLAIETGYEPADRGRVCTLDPEPHTLHLKPTPSSRNPSPSQTLWEGRGGETARHKLGAHTDPRLHLCRIVSVSALQSRFVPCRLSETARHTLHPTSGLGARQVTVVSTPGDCLKHAR